MCDQVYIIMVTMQVLYKCLTCTGSDQASICCTGVMTGI